MKKVFVLAAFAAVLAVSCQKNEAPVGEPAQIPIEEPAGIPMKLIASIGDVSKITYEPDGNVLKSNWEASETISVVTLDGSGKLVCVDNFTSTGVAGREKAEFSGTFNGGDSPYRVIVIYPALTENGAGKYESAPYYNHTGSETPFLYDGAVGNQYIQGRSQPLKQNADNDASHLKNYCVLGGVANKDDIKANTLNVTLSNEMIVLKVVATFPASLKGKPLRSMVIDSYNSSNAAKGWSRSGSWEYLDFPSEGGIAGRGSGYSSSWDLYANDIIIPDSGTVTLYFVNFLLNNMETGDKLKFTAQVGSEEYGIATKTFTANKSFDKGKVYRMSVTLTYVPAGALKGKFTVNGSGDQVYFSKGNLQAETTDEGEHWTWSFAENQYDCPGGAGSSCDNMKVAANGKSSVASCTIGLFGWSTDDNTYFGINTFKTNDDWDGNFVDWGTMAIGGTAANTWRTPTYSEYTYLLNTRTTSTVCGTANARFARATVNSVEGNILFPDAYTHPDGVADINNINVANASNGGNTISASDWDKMEAAGAVFLPQAGYFDPNYPTYVSSGRGCYWTSTSGSTTRADHYLQQESAVSANYTDHRASRYSVRLVHDVE